jgi:hypothetical protein
LRQGGRARRPRCTHGAHSPPTLRPVPSPQPAAPLRETPAASRRKGLASRQPDGAPQRGQLRGGSGDRRALPQFLGLG